MSCIFDDLLQTNLINEVNYPSFSYLILRNIGGPRRLLTKTMAGISKFVAFFLNYIMGEKSRNALASMCLIVAH